MITVGPVMISLRSVSVSDLIIASTSRSDWNCFRGNVGEISVRDRVECVWAFLSS